MEDNRILAIRTSELVGIGTCSVVDECYSDQELAAALDENGITDPIEAERWAVDSELIHRQRALNTRWGEDDDPQLLEYNEFKAAVEAVRAG